MNRSVFRVLQFGLGVLILAGIVHLLSILLMPRLALRNPAAQFIATLEPNTPTLLAEKTAIGTTIPFADPAMVAAVCPYDLSEGSVRLRLRSGETFMSLVFLNPEGRISYALTDKAAVRRLIDIRILTESQLRLLETQDPDDEPVQELRIRVKDTRGVVLVKVFNPVPSAAESNRALLQRMICAPDNPA